LVALSTACCIGVLLALKALPACHQPEVFTQISPQLQGTALAVITELAKNTRINVSAIIIPVCTFISFHILFIRYSVIPLGTDALFYSS
jgi:hypothetical protein